MVGNLENAASEVKRLAMDALDLKVRVKTLTDMEIAGVLPLALPTTAQTSGCLPFHAYVASGSDKVAPLG